MIEVEKITEAKIVLEEYQMLMSKEAMQLAISAVEKFGSAKNLLIEGLKPEFAYLKKMSKLLALMEEKQDFDIEAENITKILHDIHKIVLRVSESRGEDYMKLLRVIDIRKSLNPSPSEMQLWVMNHIGGRNLIANINYQEPNALRKKVISAIEKYRRLPELSTTLAIENQVFYKLQNKRYS